MEKEQPLLQRYGGHLVLLTLAILLIIGTEMRGVAGLFASGEEEPAASFTLNETPSSPLPQAVAPAGAELVAAEVAPEFDISQSPPAADHSLSPVLNPIPYKPGQPQHEFITYTVQPGDTAIGIADQFGINEETILGGNPSLQNDANGLWAGTDIRILPIDGVLHEVAHGDSLESISEQYGIPVEDIIAYEPNNLEFPYRLYPGTQLLVPGAVAEVWVWEPPNHAASSSSGGFRVAVPGTGVFLYPWSGGRITQHPWYGHMAIDIGLVTGSPIYASDTGTVTYSAWAAGGYTCYGNLVVINHGNGFETFYAHLSGLNVTAGQTVYQGSLVGWSGNTGCSSGPHLHFEIRYGGVTQNPWNYLR